MIGGLNYGACKRTTRDYLTLVLDTLLEDYLRLQVLLGLRLEDYLRLQVLLGLRNIFYVQTQATLVLISI